MKVRAFITHKVSEKFSDCQDRFGINPDTKSIAVSDGMGSTWQQKIWAQLLVEKYIENKDWIPTHDSIKPLCKIWREKVITHIQKLKDTPTDSLNDREKGVLEALIYRNERNLYGGRSAGATFVGIRFDEKKWAGRILGDSCLIEWDGKKAIFNTSQTGEAFDNFPDYFDSDVLKIGKGTPKSINGILTEGTILFLVSDPFSDFLLKHSHQGDIDKYILQLLSISSHDEFEKIVEEWRNYGMHNDDTTLIIIENDESDSISLLTIDDLDSLMEKEQNNNETQEMESESPKRENRENKEQPSLEEEQEPEYVQPEEFINEFIYEFFNEYKKTQRNFIVKSYFARRGMKKLQCNVNEMTIIAQKVLHKMLEKISIIKK